MGMDAYGLDLSEVAVSIAREWATRAGVAGAEERIRTGDAGALPWPDAFFDVVVSHGTLDSMPFETARAGVFLAGVVCGGMETSRFFIENSREHAQSIFNRLTAHFFSKK